MLITQRRGKKKERQPREALGYELNIHGDKAVRKKVSEFKKKEEKGGGTILSEPVYRFRPTGKKGKSTPSRPAKEKREKKKKGEESEITKSTPAAGGKWFHGPPAKKRGEGNYRHDDDATSVYWRVFVRQESKKGGKEKGRATSRFYTDQAREGKKEKRDQLGKWSGEYRVERPAEKGRGKWDHLNFGGREEERGKKIGRKKDRLVTCFRVEGGKKKRKPIPDQRLPVFVLA